MDHPMAQIALGSDLSAAIDFASTQMPTMNQFSFQTPTLLQVGQSPIIKLSTVRAWSRQRDRERAVQAHTPLHIDHRYFSGVKQPDEVDFTWAFPAFRRSPHDYQNDTDLGFPYVTPKQFVLNMLHNGWNKMYYTSEDLLQDQDFTPRDELFRVLRAGIEEIRRAIPRWKAHVMEVMHNWYDPADRGGELAMVEDKKRLIREREYEWRMGTFRGWLHGRQDLEDDIVTLFHEYGNMERRMRWLTSRRDDLWEARRKRAVEGMKTYLWDIIRDERMPFWTSPPRRRHLELPLWMLTDDDSQSDTES